MPAAPPARRHRVRPPERRRPMRACRSRRPYSAASATRCDCSRSPGRAQASAFLASTSHTWSFWMPPGRRGEPSHSCRTRGGRIAIPACVAWWHLCSAGVALEPPGRAGGEAGTSHQARPFFETWCGGSDHAAVNVISLATSLRRLIQGAGNRFHETPGTWFVRGPPAWRAR